MPMVRKIQAGFTSQPTVEGAGVRLKRAFGYHQAPRLDPFLMLDDFHSSDPADYIAGFPWHPHRGIETITYILEGRVEHGDSMGNKGVIGSGDVQWMTAGSGIIHQEMPQKTPSGMMWGFQLWANLPASHKMMPPRYRDVMADDIPLVTLDNGVVARIISGEVGGVRGPVRDIVIDPVLMDISIPAGAVFNQPVKDGYTALAYVLIGKAWFDVAKEQEIGPERLVLYEHTGGRLIITAMDKPVRLLFLSGKRLNEPVAWKGPIVMNTEEELRIAYEEYRQGTFVK